MCKKIIPQFRPDAIARAAGDTRAPRSVFDDERVRLHRKRKQIGKLTCAMNPNLPPAALRELADDAWAAWLVLWRGANVAPLLRREMDAFERRMPPVAPPPVVVRRDNRVLARPRGARRYRRDARMAMAGPAPDDADGGDAAAPAAVVPEIGGAK